MSGDPYEEAKRYFLDGMRRFHHQLGSASVYFPNGDALILPLDGGYVVARNGTDRRQLTLD